MANQESVSKRADFKATGDPALSSAPDEGQQTLLDYPSLYALWERQQWATQEIDFSQDRIDWHERFDAEERKRRMFLLSSFFVGEQRVAAELGPIMVAAPTEPIRLFLCTQIADEARHVAFFNRFYEQVGIVDAVDLEDRLGEAGAHVNDEFRQLFDQLLRERVARVTRDPDDLVALVEAVTLYHMVIEGTLALTGQHFSIEYNERMGTLPGFVAGFTNVARDEHRHVAFGARFLKDMASLGSTYREAIERTLAQALPLVAGVFRPPWVDPEDEQGEIAPGRTVGEAREFAADALERRLRAVGLAVAA